MDDVDTSDQRTSQRHGLHHDTADDGKKKGETVNNAAIVIEERVNKMQGWQEKEER